MIPRTSGLLVVLALAACSSAPAEPSVHTDTTADSASGETPRPVARSDAAAEATPADRAADVPVATLEALRSRFACNREGPPAIGSRGLACGVLSHFARGRAPDLRDGVLPGVVVEPGEDGRDFARPALLAIRGTGARAKVAWGRILPHDPREAADLAQMSADVLENRAPSLVPLPWPGLAWASLQRTEGASVQIATSPRVLARQSDDFVAIVVLDETAPVFALHRAPAR